MKKQLIKPGVSILIFVVLMSSFLLVCTGVWKTTTYLVDFTLQKQVYTQKKYFTEGILRWASTWVKHNWDSLQKLLQKRDRATYSLEGWPCTIEHLKFLKPTITLYQVTPKKIGIEVVLTSQSNLDFKASCQICSFFDSGFEQSFQIQSWHVGA